MFKYDDHEKKINKILKLNQDKSKKLLKNASFLETTKEANFAIQSSEELLKSLGYNKELESAKLAAIDSLSSHKLEKKSSQTSWDSLVKQAEDKFTNDILIEDLLSKEEIDIVTKKQLDINRMFSNKTTIVNKTDLTFLSIATALQVTKSLLFPIIASKFDYGASFDPKARVNHDDKIIKSEHRKANDEFVNKNLQQNKKGYWVNILYQGVPYDAIKGSKNLGLGLAGTNHRLHTLGHDPILGWVFGTMNILTDTITMNSFTTYKVLRKPTIITNQTLSILDLITQSYDVIKSDKLNLPAAIFAQSQHIKSDIFTKQGLPVPLLTTFSEDFASKLYKQNYDSLCFARDSKIVGISYVISTLIDLIITLVHSMYREDNEPQELYEIRTRKILLISNSIATSSTLINVAITQNLNNLDIASLLTSVSHLFSDITFISKIKDEFINSEINSQLQSELNRLDKIYSNI